MAEKKISTMSADMAKSSATKLAVTVKDKVVVAEKVVKTTADGILRTPGRVKIPEVTQPELSKTDKANVALKYGMATFAAASISDAFAERCHVDLDNAYLGWMNSMDLKAATEIKKKYEQHKEVLGNPYDDITPVGDGWYKQTYTKVKDSSLGSRLGLRDFDKQIYEKVPHLSTIARASVIRNAAAGAFIPKSTKATAEAVIPKSTKAVASKIDVVASRIRTAKPDLVESKEEEPEPVTMTNTALYKMMQSAEMQYVKVDNAKTNTSELYSACLEKEFAPAVDVSLLNDMLKANADVLSGAIFYNVQVLNNCGPFVIYGDTYSTYKELKEELGRLGFPQSDETKNAAEKTFQYFENGCIYSKSATNRIVIFGEIYEKWIALGRENSYLGYPKTSVVVETYEYDPNNVQIRSLILQPTGIEHADFDGGTVYKSSYGAFAVHEKIFSEWVKRGKNGSPITDTTIENGTYKNYFQKNGDIFSIRWNQQTGYVLETKTDELIRVKYEQNATNLGVRSSANLACENKGWTKCVCEKGAIYYHPSVAGSPFIIYGDIYTKYVNMGSEISLLGYPKMDICKTPDNIGKYAHFDGGSIYWSPQSGAHEIHGSIKSKFAELGWETGYLGYPLTDELIAADGEGRYNNFQGGSIYWTPKYGVHDVHALIQEVWKQRGLEKGRLGYPIKDGPPPSIYDGYRDNQQSFQGGEIHIFRGSITVIEPKVNLKIWLNSIKCVKTYYEQTTQGRIYHDDYSIKTGHELISLLGIARDSNNAEYKITTDVCKYYSDPLHGGDYYDGKIVNKWGTYVDDITLFTIPLNGAGWPKEFVISLSLINRGFNSDHRIMNNLDNLQTQALNMVGNEIKKYGDKLSSSIGAIAGTFLGGGPWGTLLGGAAGAGIGKVVDVVKSLFSGKANQAQTDDVEPEIVYTPAVFKVSVHDILSRFGTLNTYNHKQYGDRVDTLTITHGRAQYELCYTMTLEQV